MHVWALGLSCETPAAGINRSGLNRSDLFRPILPKAVLASNGTGLNRLNGLVQSGLA